MNIFKNPIMLLMLVLFLALVGATAYRIVTALQTHPGLVVDDAYKSGEAYGKTLKQKNQLKKQGWSLDLITPLNVAYNKAQTYKAIFVQNKTPSMATKVVAYFYRPLEKKFDFSKSMSFNNNDNSYQVDIKLPLKGRWDVVIEANKDGFVLRKSSKMFAK